MYNVNFLTQLNYAEFWKMLEGLVKFISPFLMIGVGIILAGWLISLVVKTFRTAVGRDNEEGYQRDNNAKTEADREQYKQKYKY